MKKLLGVIGILALAAALLPAQGFADLRGAWAPLTVGVPQITGQEQAAHRPVDADGIMVYPVDGRPAEEWISYSARSLVPGREGVRSIYLFINQQQGFLIFGNSALGTLRNDPSASISYFDPAWSYDGRFLAYVQANFDGTDQALYVQEFLVSDGLEFDYGPGLGADTPVGAPILIANTGNPRRPDWHPSQHTLAFDSDAFGSSDIYTIDVDVVGGTTSNMTRRTFDDVKAEQSANWAPNGHEIAYSTNKFGPNVLEIIDLNLVSTAPGYARLAELNFAQVSHNNPSFTADGTNLLYDAPAGEDPNGGTTIWKLDLTTQGKCEINLDPVRADGDPDASTSMITSNEGDPVYYFYMTSQANNFGITMWRGNQTNACLLPLKMGVATIPAVMDLEDETTATFTTVMNFPPETRSEGYRCSNFNAGLVEGVKLRSTIFVSPTLLGLENLAGLHATHPGSNTSCYDSLVPGAPDSLRLNCVWDFRTIADRIVALGLVDKIVPMKMTAYSNLVGRPFQGFAYMKLTENSLPAAGIALLGNSPNPFNPVTKIRFAVSKPGTYTLRLYNVQGALVKTVASKHYEAGTHEATWDGRTASGGKAASGVYYAKATGADGTSAAGMKMVLAK
jgi:Tol biopolymer transport system component